MQQTVKKYILLAAILCATAQDIGEQCVLENDNFGVCEDIINCKSSLEDLRKRITPKLCGFTGYKPIICCRDNTTATTTTLKSKTNPRISEEKCQEYLSIRIPQRGSPTLGGGGVDAIPKEFSHMAMLGYEKNGSIEYKCGGSLISYEFVLTAAHCLETNELGPVTTVRLGDLDTASDQDDAEPQDFRVIERHPHPDYDYKSFYNDIAVIKLSRPVHVTNYVMPACLQFESKFQYDRLTATGWGALYFGGDMHNKLQKLDIHDLPKEKCLPTYGPQLRLRNGIDEELQICGGNLNKSVDTCHGDSGGPLQVKIQDEPPVYRIVGVTSFGINCNLVPGVYTRVSKYISWIQSVVWPT